MPPNPITTSSASRPFNGVVSWSLGYRYWQASNSRPPNLFASFLLFRPFFRRSTRLGCRVLGTLVFCAISPIATCWMSTPANAASSPYLLPANAAALWLASQQNRDGSWGEVATIRLLDTVEARFALRTVRLQRRGNHRLGGADQAPESDDSQPAPP